MLIDGFEKGPLKYICTLGPGKRHSLEWPYKPRTCVFWTAQPHKMNAWGLYLANDFVHFKNCPHTRVSLDAEIVLYILFGHDQHGSRQAETDYLHLLPSKQPVSTWSGSQPNQNLKSLGKPDVNQPGFEISDANFSFTTDKPVLRIVRWLKQ